MEVVRMTTKQRIEEAANSYTSTLEILQKADEVFHPASYYAGMDKGFIAGAEFGAALEREKAKKLVEALKFYGDEGSWNWQYKSSDRSEITSDIDDDFGVIARKALDNYESEEG